MKLEVDSAYYSVGEKTILSGVYLSLTTNEIVGVLGRNGSGKSTLFKSMFGLIKPDYINLRIDGSRSKTPSANQLLQLLPQNGFLFDSTKINEVLFHFDISVDKRDNISKLIESDDSVRVRSLSIGQRRMLEVMVLLYSKSRFIIFDEPFTGLSPLNVEIMTELIRKESRNKGILISDHLYGPILELADRVLIMEAGTLKSIENNEQQLVQHGYLKYLSTSIGFKAST